MIRSFSFLFPLLISVVTASAQTDTTYIITRNGVESRFVFKKAATLTQLRSFTPVSFPVYTMTSVQHNRMRDLLYRFVALEGNLDELRKTRHQQDSAFKIKEATFTDAYQKQELRANNFEKSYNDLLNVNATLVTDLKKCETLAIAENKRRKPRPLVMAALAVGGFILGAAVF